MRLLTTIVHLKSIQVFFQLKYRALPAGRLKEKDYPNEPRFLKLLPTPGEKVLEIKNGDYFVFQLLNKQHEFNTRVDWGEMSHGRLWNYHLQYADFLKQDDLPEETRVSLVTDLYDSLVKGRILLEPYPASLRIHNVIRFLCADKTRIGRYNSLLKPLWNEILFVSSRLECHLMANHLLENGFALLIGGWLFNDEKTKRKARKLLTRQLKEQVLSDGAHFELSPMYHRIVLIRVLEALTYVPAEDELHEILNDSAEAMIRWMRGMTFRNSWMPNFNDATNGVVPEPKTLLDLAKGIGLHAGPDNSKLSGVPGVSGYRRFANQRMELIVDVNGIDPPYQPGHAHADTFSFELHVDGVPVIVDPGISTYDRGERREWERSTAAHNTVTVKDMNSSNVWASHRVGKRARVKIINEGPSFIKAQHDGYRGIGVNHQRLFRVNHAALIIEDEIKGRSVPAKARFYLHPESDVVVEGGKAFINGSTSMTFEGADTIELNHYLYAEGFNKLLPSKVIEIGFSKHLQTTFSL